jgi:hypothetical protein
LEFSSAAQDDPSSNNEVDTTKAVGDPSKFSICGGSFWIRSTRTIGDGVGTYVQVEPTQAARKSLPSGREDDPVYRALWDDLRRCTHIGRGMTASQLHSVYMQMACHARYGLSSHFTGNTWDLEAWRNDVDWSEGLSLGGKCGQSYGDVDNAGRYLHGRIVNAFPDPNPQQLTAWLVDTLQPNSVDVRLHIKTVRAYGCLRDQGKEAASWFPDHFLDQYVPIVTREIGDEVCPPPPTQPSTPLPALPNSPAPATRVTAYNNYGGGAVGRAMCRGNPARPESMPGGTASQAFIVPTGVASIDSARVQIDPDNTVTAHASLLVDGSVRATADASASGDTNFAFPSVPVKPGDQITLSISFTATFGKIITVYTVGNPGGTFTAANSCPDGAPSVSTSSTGLRAVMSGWSA